MADSLDCRKASRLLSVAFERTLTEDELEALRRHLEHCRMCRNFEAQLKFLHKAAERFRSGD